MYVHVILDATGFDSEAYKTGAYLGLHVPPLVGLADLRGSFCVLCVNAGVDVCGTRLGAGDGAFISRSKESEPLQLRFAGSNADGKSSVEFIVFDLKKKQ